MNLSGRTTDFIKQCVKDHGRMAFVCATKACSPADIVGIRLETLLDKEFQKIFDDESVLKFQTSASILRNTALIPLFGDFTPVVEALEFNEPEIRDHTTDSLYIF